MTPRICNQYSEININHRVILKSTIQLLVAFRVLIHFPLKRFWRKKFKRIPSIHKRSIRFMSTVHTSVSWRFNIPLTLLWVDFKKPIKLDYIYRGRILVCGVCATTRILCWESSVYSLRLLIELTCCMTNAILCNSYHSTRLRLKLVLTRMKDHHSNRS